VSQLVPAVDGRMGQTKLNNQIIDKAIKLWQTTSMSANKRNIDYDLKRKKTAQHIQLYDQNLSLQVSSLLAWLFAVKYRDHRAKNKS